VAWAPFFVFVVFAVVVSSAAARSPWWHVNSTERPLGLQQPAATEVQEVVEANSTEHPADGFELKVGGKPVGTFVTEPLEKTVETDFGVSFPLATAAEVQKALEGEEFYGPGNVEVIGEPGPEPSGTVPSGATGLRWVIKSVGKDGGEVVAPVEAETGFIIGFLNSQASKPTASIVVEGHPKGGQLVLTVSNLGDATVLGSASPVKVTDMLPAGLRPLYISGRGGAGGNRTGDRGPLVCPTSKEVQEGKPLVCVFEKTERVVLNSKKEPVLNSSHEPVTEVVPAVLPPYEHLELVVGVKVEDEALAALGRNEVSVSGGEGYVCQSVGHGHGSFSSQACMAEENGAGVEAGGGFERSLTGVVPSASLSFPVGFGSAGFGVEAYELTNELEGGEADTQAGSHPFQQTTTIFFNQTAAGRPVALPKDVHLKWPVGLVGNPTPLPKCTIAQFLTVGKANVNACPADTQVGVAVSTVNELGAVTGLDALQTPLFNLEPLEGEPARFGFYVPNAPVFIDPTVRDGEDYGITVNADNITQVESVLSSQVTVWGVPGDPVHDAERGWGCLFATRGVLQKEQGIPVCEPQEQVHPPSFLAMPTWCSGHPMDSIVEADSWSEPGHVVKASTSEASVSQQPMPVLDGCNELPFGPSITVKPDTQAASSSSGLTVDVHIPQEESLNANGLAVADPRSITVALPEGVAVNPAGGDGLGACTEGQVGFEGFEELPTEPGVNGPVFAPGVLEPFSPDSAKIGTATITTPLLAHSLEGSVYLATQNQNPFSPPSLLAMYIVAEDKQSGVQVKLAGQVQLCETVGQQVDGMSCQAPGQLITRFENSPQAPFEDAELHFFGGERAPLATPARCRAYTTQAAFVPWSAEPGEAPHTATSTFDITSGPNGSACPGAVLPFAPSLTGGSTSINAGSFSPLTTTIGRQDGEQDLQQVKLHMPAGLEGLLSSVKLCPEAQANTGACGPESLIGETTVAAGVGSDPVSVKGGRVYITGPYGGAPFGLSIVNPVKAGPFDLEHDTANPAQDPACDCLVVRAKIEVNPRTAELTITTDPSGPHAIPHLIDGIPVQIKKVNVLVNRPNFTFNPTSCSPLSMTGAITGVEGASSPVSVPFQATNCAVLRFEPKAQVSTAAKPSKANGSSLAFKIAYPKGAMGSQSWFNEAKFDIPKQLPARLTTIQKACLAAVFETNPAACPAASLIGHAIVHTQVLPVPLTGPVYFVSYGATKFPDAVLVLQGYGVTVDLHGETFINNKTGVTSATFRDTPDVPFESIEVTVPAGPFSEFASNLPASAHGSFCGQNLTMPTLFKAQNGLEIHQNTPVNVTGCPKPKTRAQLYTAALKACRKKHSHPQRAACERQARKRYGPKPKKASRHGAGR
jgi:hypothetical protein